jgi:peptide methionine sulfoxide reductase MsrA
VEVLNVDYDPAKVDYKALVRHFFTFHDPTTLDRQGNDRGTQYASVIFYHDEEQKAAANEASTAQPFITTAARSMSYANPLMQVIAELQARLDKKAINFVRRFEGDRVTTTLRPASQFIPAHEEHQEYLVGAWRRAWRSTSDVQRCRRSRTLPGIATMVCGLSGDHLLLKCLCEQWNTLHPNAL